MSSLHDPRYRTIIDRLRKLRESKRVTQVDLASCLKKHQSYVAKVENCERRLDIIELQDWLKALEIEITSFLKE